MHTPTATTGRRRLQTDRVVLLHLRHSDRVRSIACSTNGTTPGARPPRPNKSHWALPVPVSRPVGKLSSGGGQPVRVLALSPDGKLMVTQSEHGTVNVCVTGSENSTVPLDDGVNPRWTSVAFSPHGERIATGCGDSIKLWDLNQGDDCPRPLYPMPTATISIQGHTGTITSLAFSDEHLVAASNDIESNTFAIKIWTVDDRDELQFPACDGHNHTDEVTFVAVSPDGCYLASASKDMTVKLWEIHSGALIHCVQAGKAVYSVAFSPCGRQLFFGTGDVNVCDLSELVAHKATE